MKKFNELPVTEQAYVIISVMTGSWLYNALHPQITEEKWCTNFVNHWRQDEGIGVVERFDEYLRQDYIDDCKCILSLMNLNDFKVVPPSAVDMWTKEEIDDFLVNYGPHWLTHYKKVRE